MGPGVEGAVTLALVVVMAWSAITWAHWSSDTLWDLFRGGGLVGVSLSHPLPLGVVFSTMDVCKPTRIKSGTLSTHAG